MKIKDIKPLAGYVLLKEVREERLLMLPDNAKAASRKYVVIAAGKGKVAYGERDQVEVKPGDIIKFSSGQVAMMTLDAEDGRVFLGTHDDLAAIVGFMPVEEALAHDAGTNHRAAIALASGH